MNQGVVAPARRALRVVVLCLLGGPVAACSTLWGFDDATLGSNVGEDGGGNESGSTDATGAMDATGGRIDASADSARDSADAPGDSADVIASCLPPASVCKVPTDCCSKRCVSTYPREPAHCVN